MVTNQLKHARRTLARFGITTPEELAMFTDSEILCLRNIGTGTLAIMRKSPVAFFSDIAATSGRIKAYETEVPY